jgi:hypothetical protein
VEQWLDRLYAEIEYRLLGERRGSVCHDGGRRRTASCTRDM